MNHAKSRRIPLAACAAVVCTLLLASACGWARAQSQPKPAGQPPAGGPDMEKIMQMMQPGPEHQELMKLAGKWHAVNKMWMDPSGEPMVSEGTAEWKPILGGRYLEGHYTATIMGQPFEGLSIDGYDRYKKQYCSIWLDTMGTGMLVSTGGMSPDHKTMTMKGSMFDPYANADVTTRSVSTFVDDNTLRMEMYSSKDGRETKSMEVVYTREK